VRCSTVGPTGKPLLCQPSTRRECRASPTATAMIESLLLTTARVSTFFGTQALTGASGFFFQRDERLYMVTNRHVLIEGHTDSIGGDELNLALSQKRADAVKERLVAKGVAEERITTRGYGKKYPLASNETPAGRQQNRRVEVIILNEGVKPESQLRD